MKNILWVSRHTPSIEQSEELREFVGEDYTVSFMNRTVNGVQDILDYTDDETVGIMAVLSPELLGALVRETNIPVFRAVTDRIMTGRGNVEFKHDHFEIVEELTVRTRRLI